MKAERLKDLESLFFTVLECPRAERSACLQRLCGDDVALREELQQLMSAHEVAEQQPTLSAVEAVAQEIAQAMVPLVVPEHYEVLQELGRGGMGEVLLARDKRLQRKVALKFLSPAFAADHERRSRFEQEARLASALNHPNILTVYEIAAVDGTYFMATEYVEGETLRQRLRKAPLTETEALNIALQIAAALEAAHTHGIIHRDIKPENIMLRPDGYVKVLDFGIAKITDPQVVGANTVGIQTATGQIVGTPAYIAPEQLRGLKLDGRSDLFGLGVVLYEMLVGEQPFTGVTVAEVLAAILHQELQLPAQAKLSPGFAAIVTKALRKAPEERFQTAAEFSAALLQANEFSTSEYPIQPETMADHVVSQPTPRQLWFGIVPLMLVVLLGVMGYRYWKSEKAPPVSVAPPQQAVERLRYAVEISTSETESLFTDGTVPISGEKAFKFHFTAQKNGYLYIVAPGARNVLQTFLTASAVKRAQTVRNVLTAHQPYAFPAAKEDWLGLNETLITTFTVIFSTTPLSQPAFLTAPAGHELTIAEQGEWEVFKKQFGVQTVTPLPKNTSETQALPAQTLVVQNPDNHLIIFDVTLQRQ